MLAKTKYVIINADYGCFLLLDPFAGSGGVLNEEDYQCGSGDVLRSGYIVETISIKDLKKY